MAFIVRFGTVGVDIINCANLEGAIGRGMSGAWKVRGVDRKFYIVKFHVDGDRTALNELLCTYLSRRFRLPTLEPVLVQLSDAQTDQVNAERIREGLHQVERGPHFGIQFIDSFLTVESFPSKVGREIVASDLNNLDSVPQILGFDTLVQNNDRKCDNVGLEPDIMGAGYSYLVFDFGLAFGGTHWSTQSVRASYRNLQPIMQFCLFRDEIRSQGDFEEFLGAFEVSLEAWMDEFLVEIPAEWGTDAKDSTEEVRAAMAELKRDALAGAIAKSLRAGM